MALHDDNKGGNGHLRPTGRVYKDTSDAAMKKREYMKRWRDSKKAQGLGSAGKVIKSTYNGKGNNTVNKFSLEREFSLEEKDLRLMISYLVSWKGMGRLTAEEVQTYSHIEGIPLGRFVAQDKELLRKVFYSCRQRVMDKSKVTTDA